MTQQITRIFRRRGCDERSSLTISLSLGSEAQAAKVARALDRIKAAAAFSGDTFSQRLARLILEAGRKAR